MEHSKSHLTLSRTGPKAAFSNAAGAKANLSGAKANFSVELGKGCCCIDSGEARIRQLGYKQELARNFGLLSNASIGFTAISILTGITGAPNVHLMRLALYSAPAS